MDHLPADLKCNKFCGSDKNHDSILNNAVLFSCHEMIKPSRKSPIAMNGVVSGPRPNDIP